MKEKVLILISIFLLAIIAYFGIQNLNNQKTAKVEVMPSEDLKVKLDSEKKLFLLDVREKNEYDEEHIDKATFFPKSKFDAKDQTTEDILRGIKKTDLVVTYCGSGHRSGWVASELKKRGYKNVYNLDGISFWKKKYETVKGPKEKNIEPIRVKSEEAKYNYDNFKDIVWLDVRDVGEYDSGHIAGAKSIPLTEIEKRLSELPKDKEIFLYCSGTFGGGSCSASLSAARILVTNGFSYGKIKVYEEGYETWAHFEYPIEK